MLSTPQGPPSSKVRVPGSASRESTLTLTRLSSSHSPTTGIVPGGGTALLWASRQLEDIKVGLFEIGLLLLLLVAALTAPFLPVSPTVTIVTAAPFLTQAKTENLDQKIGVEIIERACRAPIKAIADNAGEEGSVIVGECLKHESHEMGFDARHGEWQREQLQLPSLGAGKTGNSPSPPFHHHHHHHHHQANT